MLSLLPVGCLVYECSENVPLIFFLYITLNMYFSSLNIMRQSIALDIVALGIVCLLCGKTAPFVLSVILAFLFHRSAVYLLILLPLRRLPIIRKVSFAYIVACVAAFIFSEPWINLTSGLYGTVSQYDETYTDSIVYGAASTLRCQLSAVYSAYAI